MRNRTKQEQEARQLMMEELQRLADLSESHKDNPIIVIDAARAMAEVYDAMAGV